MQKQMSVNLTKPMVMPNKVESDAIDGDAGD
jgi:hypothetical protein